MTPDPRRRRRPPPANVAEAYGLRPTPASDPVPAPAPRTDGAMRLAISNTPGADRFRSLIRSAYRDSLEQLTGAPQVYNYDVTPHDLQRGDGQLLADGQYRHAPGAPDTVVLSPTLLEHRPLGRAPRTAAQQSAPQPEFVLAHELGHRNRDVRTAAAGTGADPVVAQQDSAYAAQQAAPAGSIRAAYWNASPDEHYAESFANGVSYLRSTAGKGSDPDVVARSSPDAARYERAVPGTRAMVAALLADPLFANHPIRRAMQPPRAAADATSTRGTF